MGHFAKVVNQIVVEVIVAEKDFFDTFIDSSPGEWLQTSYNTRGGIYYDPNTNVPAQDQSKAYRKNYAGIGYKYDILRDAFIPPKPFDSWVLNDFSCLWEAPIPYPQDGTHYSWDEQQQNWVIQE